MRMFAARNIIYILLVVLSLLVITGCKEPAAIDGNAFKDLWQESVQHSAISWWYVGETDSHFFIAEKWPTKYTIYQLSKNEITLIGIKPFQPKSGFEPVNLKSDNITFE
ncbi:MAG TPA: hypothetical protein PLM29_09885 [Deltaproteobacteria bacterium]|nr:hypothetical protein [Deltaproteobacteria bacterium]